MEALFGDLTVEQVRETSSGWTTPDLLAAFERYRDYRSAAEWNGLVRICEALAVVGWGEHEPVEAFAERWINGSFYTQLRNRRFEVVHGSDRQWSRHGSTFVPQESEDRPVDPTVTGLLSQRISLARNPVRLARPGNHQAAAKPFVDELARLRALLDRRLARPYGPGFGQLEVRLSFHQPAARAGLTVGRLIERRGEITCTATRHYTDADTGAELAVQQQAFATDLDAALDDLARKLRRKAPDYRITDLRTDTAAVVGDWLS